MQSSSVEEQPHDLLRVGDQAQVFLAKNGYFSPPHWAEFWNSPKTASISATLITRILLILTGEDKHITVQDSVKKLANNSPGPIPELQRFPDLDADSNQVLQNIITTAWYTAAFYEFNPTFPALKLAVGRLFSFRQKTKSIAPSTPEYSFIGELERMLQVKDYLLQPDNLKFLIQQSAAIDCPIEPSDKMTVAYMAPALFHSWLRWRMLDSVRTKEIFTHILDLMKHPGLHEDTVLSLLYMIKTFLHFSPVPPTDLYPLIIQRARQYYTWPRPYSDCARDVLELVTLERKAPGSALRARIQEENPLISGEPNVQPTGREKLAYLIFDKDVTGSKLLHETLKNFIPPAVPVPEIQIRLLHCLYMSNAPTIDPSSLGLEFLKRDDVGKFYAQAIKIMDSALGAENPQQAEAYRVEQLGKLKNQILAAVTPAQSMPIPRPIRMPPLDLNIRFAGFSNPPPNRDSNYNTTLHYPRRESLDTLYNILYPYITALDPNVPQTMRQLVKIGIIGNDATIHNLVAGVVCLRLSYPDWWDKLDVRFFFIPSGPSELATWIGSQDKWYGRHVVCLSKTIQSMYPAIQIPTSVGGENSVISSDAIRGSRSGQGGAISMVSLQTPTGDFIGELERQINPSLILRNEVENYFREAKWPLNLNIYRCECYTTDTEAVTVPFFSRAQIGLLAHVEAFRKINDLPLSLNREEVMGSKNFKYSPITVSMRYSHMSPLHKPRSVGTQEMKSYESITVASLPVVGDKQNYVYPNPTKPSLELLVVDEASRRRGEKSRQEAKTFHVSYVEIAGDKKEQLYVLLDGRVYGPYIKLKITAATHPQESDLIYTMPIMTFMPIALN